MLVPASVSILGKPTSGQFRVRENSELGLVCLAEGEPLPSVSWRREGKALPDGSSSLPGDELIFSRLGRDHAGTYICRGVTGEGRLVEDVVGVVVECEYRPVVFRHVQPCIALIANMRHSSALIIHSRDPGYWRKGLRLSNCKNWGKTLQ